MTAQEVIDEVRRAGGRLIAVGTHLRVEVPRRCSSRELRDEIVRNKKGILASISSERPDPAELPRDPFLQLPPGVVRQLALRVDSCFLCKMIAESYRENGQLADARHDYRMEALFQIEGQLNHLKLEFGFGIRGRS